MKNLLAGLFLAMAVNLAAAAEPLNLTLEVYRITGGAGLAKDMTPTAQLELLADKRPEITQAIGVALDVPAQSAIVIGSTSFKVEALAKFAKTVGYALTLKVTLDEQVLAGGVNPITTSFAADTKLSVRLGQRVVAATRGEGEANGVAQWTLLVVGLER